MYSRLLLPGLFCLIAGCATPGPVSLHTTNPASSTLQGDSERPAEAAWLRSELYFSLGPVQPGAGSIDAGRWTAFLDTEVTPRFPDGFSVLDAYGQWRDRGAATPERLSTKVIVILYENTARHRDDIEAIRLAWKRITGDLSVLRLTQPAQVSF